MGSSTYLTTACIGLSSADDTYDGACRRNAGQFSHIFGRAEAETGRHIRRLWVGGHPLSQCMVSLGFPSAGMGCPNPAILFAARCLLYAGSWDLDRDVLEYVWTRAKLVF
jgi:hypothetical protein